jgi:tight adherence protein C
LLLYNKAIKRKSLIGETLADVVESLYLCVGAGLAFSGALDRVAKQNEGPIPEEFGRVLNEMQVGKSRSDSLLSMSERCGQRELTKFVQTINQIDKHGIPISSALKEIAKDLRLERRAKAREMGQKIPVKILAPIMLCFLPCVVIIVLTPAAVSITNGIMK